VWILAFGGVGAATARSRQRRPEVWAVYGALLGPIALLLLEVAPPGRCWNCGTKTEGWLARCQVCGADVRVPGTPGGATNAVRRPSLVSLPGGAVAMTPMARPVSPEAPAVRAETVPSWAQPARTSSRATPDDQADQEDEAPQVVEAAEAAPGSRSRRGRARRSEPDRSRPSATNGPAAASSLGTRVNSSSTDAAGSRQSTQSKSRGQGKAASSRGGGDADTGPPRPEEIVLASAIFMTGSRGLAAGSRYGVGWSGDQLRILGPVDVDPKATGS